jgi:putative protease
MKKIELLSPAGNLEKLKTAVIYGADAVYIGGEAFSLRAAADNFDRDTMNEGLKFAHDRGRKVYVAVNIFPHNADLKALPEYIKSLYESGVDAILVSDPGVFLIAREAAPDLEIHISTQANNVNYKSAEFWHKLGAKRIVLARELSLREIKEIREHVPDDLELEAFVHGSMCISYSGRCLLSNYMTYRDSNRGLCAHPCRYKYSLVEEKRPNQYFPVFEDEHGTYILNSHDLCMIEHIPEVIESGITSLKIEGRMKSAYYTAVVTRAYREALDSYLKDKDDYKVNPKWLSEVSKASHRDFSTGFYFGKPEKQIYTNSSYIRTYDIVGIVKDYDENSKIAVIEQRNKVLLNDEVEILSPDRDSMVIKLDKMWDEEGNSIDSAPHPQMIYKIKTDIKLKPYDMLTKEKGEYDE